MSPISFTVDGFLNMRLGDKNVWSHDGLVGKKNTYAIWMYIYVPVSFCIQSFICAMNVQGESFKVLPSVSALC